MRHVEAYLQALVSRLQTTVGELVGVSAGGSYALGAYEPERSDVDVAAVVAHRLDETVKRHVADATRHESLPCPARGLELVVYRREAVEAPTAEPAFELNVNSGAGVPFRLDLEPQPGERHWFALDRAILAERGVRLFGPPAGDVIAAMPRTLVLPLLLDSLGWYLANDAPADDAVLNACRALRYLADGTWSAKPDAGRWALEHLPDGAVIAEALRARRGKATVDSGAARRFVEGARAKLNTRP